MEGLGPRLLVVLTLVGMACSDSGSDAPEMPVEPAPADTSSSDGSPPADSRADSAVPSDSAVGSDTKTTSPDTEDTSVAVDTAPIPPCEPPLTLLPASGTLPLYGAITLQASGGTGAYQFELLGPETYGHVDVQSGIYVADGGSDASGTPLLGPGTDVVRVSDTGCDGSAEATLTVVEPLQVIPATAAVLPAATINFDTVGGSGEFLFDAVQWASGGSISPEGGYTAGTGEGTDTIRVTDLQTGQFLHVPMHVSASHVMRPAHGVVGLPIGSTYVPQTVSGTGDLTWTMLSGQAHVDWSEDGALHALTPGSAELLLTDSYTQQTAVLTIQVMEAKQVPYARSGEDRLSAPVLSPGDLNGDGFSDVVMGHMETDLGAYNGGAVFVYAGTAEGFEAEPVQTLVGHQREGEFGRAVLVGYFVGEDSELDLVVGAPNQSVSGSDNGAVYVYKGLPNGFFAEEPEQVLSGYKDRNLMGYQLASCDANGDDLPDLITVSRGAEDLNHSPIVSDSGAIEVFYGSGDGFAAQADERVFGKLPNEAGGYDLTKFFMLGYGGLAVGDMNGDGLCDVASSYFAYKGVNDRPADGCVLVYAGEQEADTGQIHLSSEPYLVLRPDPDMDPVGNSFTGRFLAMGDLNGDDKDELIVSQQKFSAVEVPGKEHGAVRVIDGAMLPSGPDGLTWSPQDPALVVWELVGQEYNDWAGFFIDVADVNGDGRGDLMVGTAKADFNGNNDRGTVEVYLAQEGAWPETEASVVFGGLKVLDRFGMSAQPVGVVAGSNAAGFFAYAELVDDLGSNVGRPYWVAWGAWADPLPLGLPGKASGAQIGESLDIVGDLNGDGYADLVMGAAHEANQAMQRTASGNVYLLLGGAEGFETVAQLESQSLTGFVGHQNAERFGELATRAGDFTGDGRPDFAVAGRLTDRKADDSLLAIEDYVVPAEGCGGLVINGGGIYVFAGVSEGLPEKRATHLYYGEEPGDPFSDLQGVGDLNGDGFDDLLAGHQTTDQFGGNTGAVHVIYGRAAVPDKTVIICHADATWLGTHVNNKMGSAVTALGDLDGDGCAEAAFGASDEKHFKVEEGAVYVLFGWGPTCNASEPKLLRLSPEITNAAVGYSLAGGQDLDGDSVPDLVVGSQGYENQGIHTGAIWLVSGAYLASLAPSALAIGTDLNSLPMQPMTDPQQASGTMWLPSAASTHFAEHLALVPGLLSDGRAGVIVGAPLSDASGTPLAGAAFVYAFSIEPYGWEATPRATLLGETYRVPGEFGDWVAGGSLGGTPMVLMGGPYGTPEETVPGTGSIDQGAVYELALPVF